MTALRCIRLLLAINLAAALAVLGPSPSATAAGRVTLTNSAGAAVIDATYATTLTVEGRGFQSVRGSSGGVYVFFGTVSGRWQPSQGGDSGEDYLYVPDSRSSANQGYQRFLAFTPGTSGASGSIKQDGSFSTTITVPGATFKAVGLNGRARTVDCRKVRCGVITIGAKGVHNGNNETFTPVQVGDLHDGSSPSADPSSGTTDAAPATVGDAVESAPQVKGPRLLEVDRTAAHTGRVMPFRASGLPAGSQVSAVLDDGVAAAGPFLVGADGAVAGVLTLPADLDAGTHELRIYGPASLDAKPVTVRFAVAVDEDAGSPPATAAEGEDSEVPWGPIVFGVSAVLFLAILARTVVSVTRRRRAPRGAAAPPEQS
ncbi:hypothetical protein ACFQ0K_11485 [Nocardioides caeni]|uniref:Uncharacterized protein n=1 Tax=Nocardioides caeni TaxID=574700 RepID=A0A4V4HLE0_9ACTN|nr:hypothetical protein [Nocardioides caeni]THV17926.1 hypothetical protein E9934_05590 [Nocardioides caeni]